MALAFNYASDRKQSTFLYSLAAHNFFQSMHETYSHSAKTAYARLPKSLKQEAIKHMKEEEEPAQSRSSTYFRKDKCCYEEQKLDLTSFHAPEVSAKDIQYKIAVRLIKALYEHAPFYQEGLEYQVVNALLTRGKKTLSELFQNDPTLYKMLKGTSSYEVGTDKGYPALTDYCSFTATDKQLSYRDIAQPVLEALVGSSLMQIIENEETVENKPLKKEKLKDLLTKHVADVEEREYLQKIFHFKHTKKGKQTASVDDNNQMILRH
jgi:hypothetical protein